MTKDTFSADTSRDIWRHGALPRLCRLFWERMKDGKVKETYQGNPRYHRLNIQFQDKEPRLDDTESIQSLKKIANDDLSISNEVSNIAQCLVASLFYFQLDGMPERRNGRYAGSGSILCSLRSNEPGFEALFHKLRDQSAYFLLDGDVISLTDNTSCFDIDGNFRKRVYLDSTDRFVITLKQGKSTPCNISGSPFVVSELIDAQGLRGACFGGPDHRKRANPEYSATPKPKRRRIM